MIQETTSSALQKAREIAALEAKALPAPFFDGNTDDGKRLILSGNQKDSKYAFDVTTQQLLGPSWYIEESAKERNATCDFLIEIRNAFPSIHAELEKVTAERDEQAEEIKRLREALEWYAGKNLEGSSHIAEKALYSHQSHA